MLRHIMGILLLALPSAAPAVAESDVNGVRDRRYCEIFIVQRAGLKLEGDVYNTLGLNDCPEAGWKAIDTEKVKQEFGAFAIVMNGPRHFVMDHIAIAKPDAPPYDFAGLAMNRVAVLHIPWHDLLNRPPYDELQVSRSTHFGFDAGHPVFELISPAGERYVMQSYAAIVDPNQRLADLPGLGGRLKLPQGWTFRTRVLAAPLDVKAIGEARIVQDELQNTYQFAPTEPGP
jgi:hypothetical protein